MRSRFGGLPNRVLLIPGGGTTVTRDSKERASNRRDGGGCMSLCVVGSVALDGVKTPFGEVDEALGLLVR